ncbi:MAG: ParB N-terminal domain-containing protein, partial [Clostridia bacterium]|nr:ParB N-terminal domain-containing protein [Clostridia bacterium]
MDTETVTTREVLPPTAKGRNESRGETKLAVNIPLNMIRIGVFVQNLTLGRGMRALVRSIEKNGVRSPICVSAEGNGMYELITGKRRVVAA